MAAPEIDVESEVAFSGPVSDVVVRNDVARYSSGSRSLTGRRATHPEEVRHSGNFTPPTEDERFESALAHQDYAVLERMCVEYYSGGPVPEAVPSPLQVDYHGDVYRGMVARVEARINNPAPPAEPAPNRDEDSSSGFSNGELMAAGRIGNDFAEIERRCTLYYDSGDQSLRMRPNTIHVAGHDESITLFRFPPTEAPAPTTTAPDPMRAKRVLQL